MNIDCHNIKTLPHTCAHINTISANQQRINKTDSQQVLLINVRWLRHCKVISNKVTGVSVITTPDISSKGSWGCLSDN